MAVIKPILTRMDSIEHLISIIDAYKAASGIERDATISHRIFGDSKKISGMRLGADITTRRLRAAYEWLGKNWPDGVDRPEGLSVLVKKDLA